MNTIHLKEKSEMQIRPYQRATDYERIGNFLIETFQPGDQLANWLQPRWEYMHYHVFIDEIDLSSFGVFEENGQILGIVHVEHAPHQAYYQVRPGFDCIKPVMFDYFETHFKGLSKSTGRMIRALYIPDFDHAMTQIAVDRGYERWDDFKEPHAMYRLDSPVPHVKLPEGFRIQSLEDDLDLEKVNRVLWRGFNHPGPPLEEDIKCRIRMKRAPNFRPELTIVAVAPDGNYVSYCGMWVVPENRIAYLEPMATDPDFRRMGLGKAVAYESMRRAASQGASAVWVGAGLPFYVSLGFQIKFSSHPWVAFVD